MEPLREFFNLHYYTHLAAAFKKTHASFDEKKFIQQVTKNLEHLSLNQRMRNTSLVLKEFLPNDYKKAISILKATIERTKLGYTNLLFPDFVGLHGLHDFKTSLNALEHFTKFGSSEFAIREFLRKDFNATIRVMYEWAQHKNYHVRRLASEGSRPRLPWSFKLDEVIKNPARTLPILETLKADAELYVRKSVANHLNDISKENPDVMLATLKNWDSKNPHTAWIMKHASRTLIKKGHKGSMAIFDFEKNPEVSIKKFKLNKTNLKIGDTLQFDFELTSQKNKPQKLVVDYIIHYQKKLGALSPKVFKLKNLELKAMYTELITKKQTFKDFTTRTHYPGKHRLEVQVNGKVLFSTDFSLIK